MDLFFVRRWTSMPVYGGGKARLGREIARTVAALEETTGWRGERYVEPFCGMLGVAVHAADGTRPVCVSDANEDVVLLLQAVQAGWDPPETPVSKAEYDALRHAPVHTAERGFYGLACAYAGIFFAGYRLSSTVHKRTFFDMFRSSLLAMRPAMQRMAISHADYRSLAPKGCTVYCDPPYRANALQSCNPNADIRGTFAGFDSDAFWDVARAWSRDNLVVVSEYEAPNDFVCVWERHFRSGFKATAERTPRVEKLFVHASRAPSST
jgi:DNA adenine methylase